MASGKVNLAERIGTGCEDFSIILLKDNTGDQTKAIVKELRDKAADINKEVFRLWLKGNGLQPVSWATLVGVLQDIGLNQLAVGIQHVKYPES
jgi:hypothetical protein